MAFTSAFFDAELVGGEYDRIYSAEIFAEYFASFIANGVFPDPSTNLQVVANTVNDMNILVSPGMGWINGYYCKNGDSYPLAIQAANGTLNRIDAVVIGWSRTNREITVYIKTGTAASSPTPPSLTRNADLYELMLATITVNAGVTKITQSMIVDKRADTSVCGWVTGVVQQIDTTNLFAQYDAAFKVWFDDIKSQLSGNVATNLQNQINSLKTSKVNVSDKASEDEAKAGMDDSKWMTPRLVKLVSDRYRTLEIGDIIHSANNVEEETKGAFIPLDGRTINLNTGYPGLANTHELNYRLPNPTVLNTGDITRNLSILQGLNIGGVYFWIGQENSSLMRRDLSGRITKLTTGISLIAECQNQLICGTTNGAYVKVYDTSGTLLRNITLNSGSNYSITMVKVSGNRVWLGVNSFNTTYGWYSDDNFATHGTTTWKNWSNGYSNDNSGVKSNLFSDLVEYKGDWYYFTIDDLTFKVYKSTDKGGSFVLHFSTPGSKTNGYPTQSSSFIHDGYVYTLGSINKKVSTGEQSQAIFLKYSLSTGQLVGKSDIIHPYSKIPYSSANGFIHDGWAYITAEYQSFKVKLDDLSWEPWSPYPNFNGKNTRGVRFGDLYLITNLTYSECIPSYDDHIERYNGIIVFHIPTGRAVCLYNSTFMENSPGESTVGVPFEGEDEIVIPCGKYSSDYKYSGLARIDLSLRCLPSLDYAYIKTKEVS